MRRTPSFFLAVAGLLTLAPTPILAAGVALLESSVKGLGNAFAGGAAVAEDATTVFFNPAGMTLLSGSQGQLAEHAILPSAKFNDAGTTFADGRPIAGGNGGDAGETVFVPNLYYVHSLSEDVKLGIGINAPFGLETEYSPGWVGRYYAIKSQLRTLNLNPSFACRLNDFFSIGGGVSIQYADAELTNAIDLSGIATGSVLSGADDGFAKVKADDFGYGANVGLLIELAANTRIGLHYRSKVKHKFKGKANFRNNGSPLAIKTAAALRLFDQGAQARVSFPETISLSAFHRMNPRWALQGDVTWTKWDRVNELRIQFDEGAPDSVSTVNWNNTWRLAAGVTYKPTPRWFIRGGAAYDGTPVPNDRRRTPRIPDESRTWAAFGVSYRASERISFDLGYAHLFVEKPRIAKAGKGEDRFRGALSGDYDADVDILSAQVTWTFP
jgi:long-chain fatty acid transport protein